MISREAFQLARRIVAGEPPREYEELYAALLELRVRFSKPNTWYVRAVARVLLGVRSVGRQHWLVPGLPGDRFEFYNVWLGRGGKYSCDCYSRRYGKSRELRVCTHVASVMLARRWEELRKALLNNAYEFSSSGSNGIADEGNG